MEERTCGSYGGLRGLNTVKVNGLNSRQLRRTLKDVDRGVYLVEFAGDRRLAIVGKGETHLIRGGSLASLARGSVNEQNFAVVGRVLEITLNKVV